jgi:preprotein translocase subunit SecE
MADETITKNPPGETDEAGNAPADLAGVEGGGAAPADEPVVPTSLGATKYVHAAFFIVGIATAFVAGKLLAGIWNALAAWPAAVRVLPQLQRYGEDERPEFTMVAGLLIGVLVVVQLFRNPGVRQWSDDVANELSKVVWPTRETVTNGTIVVIVASAIATVYVGLLDRLWGFVTTLVYGA